jgi:hypothetical protein
MHLHFLTTESTLLKNLSAIVGILGIAGTIIAILSFSRDKSKLNVDFDWDLESANEPGKYGFGIFLRNDGRRPIVLHRFGLITGLGQIIFQNTSVYGLKLKEGEGKTYISPYTDAIDVLLPHLKAWRTIRAFADNNAEQRTFSSFKPSSTDIPRWVTGTR